MTAPVDLHMHTYYSDGKASPREVLEHAAGLGLAAVAITDHESARGAREAAGLAPEFGLELVPGIEITCWWEGYSGHGGGPDIDVLGYFVDVDAAAFRQAEARLLDGVKARAEASCRYLTKLGVPLTLDEVLETSPHYPGFMALVHTLERFGRVPSGHEVFALVEDAYHADGNHAPSMAEAIELIHRFGGVAVLAHPTIVRRVENGRPPNGELLDARGLAELVEMGLDAIEVYHYRLDAAQREYFLRLADRFDLPVTGGSDEHGAPGAFARMGTDTVPRSTLELLRSLR